ncbi:hypothetical protein GEV33_000704 [Tenebrio molitor]|uniref:Uncharacterized protein n=1 Tax=Tenebrio molitor TaxID=7067 RepID=A0A8J6HXL4_TENMO|nr:hypothetical protein GEV33_000704 [Tenebrio molitor]
MFNSSLLQNYGPWRTYAAYDDGTAWSHAPHDGNAPAYDGYDANGTNGSYGCKATNGKSTTSNEKLTGICKMGFY